MMPSLTGGGAGMLDDVAAERPVQVLSYGAPAVFLGERPPRMREVRLRAFIHGGFIHGERPGGWVGGWLGGWYG